MSEKRKNYKVGDKSIGRDLAVKPVTLFTHCVGCGLEYEVKKGEKIDRLMFCSDDCANNTPIEGDVHVSYDQDGIMLTQ